MDFGGHGLSSHYSPGFPYHYQNFVSEVRRVAAGEQETEPVCLSVGVGGGVGEGIGEVLCEWGVMARKQRWPESALGSGPNSASNSWVTLCKLEKDRFFP